VTSLTIGIPVFDDFDGVYFTVQSLRLHHLRGGVEILVVDNSPASKQGRETAKFCDKAGVRYHPYTEKRGSAPTKQEVFRQAEGVWVLCLDAHVLLAAGSLVALRHHIRSDFESRNLVHGVLVHDDLDDFSTHWCIEQDGVPLWAGGILGRWASDERGRDPTGCPFTIGVSGMGCFASRRDAFPGFPPSFFGFGGEEVYVHDRIALRGDQVLCLPSLQWVHRFARPAGVPYPNAVHERFANYLVGHRVTGRDVVPLLAHYESLLPAAILAQIIAIVDEAEGVS